MSRWKYNMRSKRSYPLATYIGHIKCYVCHNFWHMAKDCNMPRSLRLWVQKQQTKTNAQLRNRPRKSWKKKEKQIGRCGISLCLCDEDDMWYIDSRCSHHMLGDMKKIYFLNRTKSDCVEFEGNETTRVLGSGKSNIGEMRTKVDDFCPIEGLRNDIFSVIQMVDEGKEVIFNSKGCIIPNKG